MNRLAVVLAVLVAACGGSSTLVAQNDGELTYGFTDWESGVDVSIGISVCEAGEGARIGGVTPLVIEGSVDYLGARQLNSPDGAVMVGAEHDYPPGAGGADLGVLGVASCDGAERSQVIVGARRTAPDGGRISGFAVTYTSGGTIETLEIPDVHLELCGDAGEYCND